VLELKRGGELAVHCSWEAYSVLHIREIGGNEVLKLTQQRQASVLEMKSISVEFVLKLFREGILEHSFVEAERPS
jgi:hypothetical protein